jgi:hypothetical protein
LRESRFWNPGVKRSGINRKSTKQATPDTKAAPHSASAASRRVLGRSARNCAKIVPQNIDIV